MISADHFVFLLSFLRLLDHGGVTKLLTTQLLQLPIIFNKLPLNLRPPKMSTCTEEVKIMMEGVKLPKCARSSSELQAFSDKVSLDHVSEACW